ncbi:MAG: AAA family ATPase [Methylococcales bacterium]|jgi:exonuclease SbcC|nr:AAA family ATPase [Methylococcales bacterium]MBT4348581.1 AAA family ATPase [Methylococcales bacterium]MBT4663382.1 AAA family ATPase [Methylococcales bacterium]MBT5951902.1 AAA family ATPase [Methylococcales bacterium]MBT6794809.1 AAA family ATPase [Methylococcales bacterium]
MKIDSIRFKNINSFKGEWLVDFNESPLSDTGVFAITGPNGSGKSSILDVITLGLYGETIKFDQPSNFVVTKQEDESFCEVSFSLGERKFQSRWSVKCKEGQVRIPEMQVIHLNGAQEIIESQPAKVRAFIADLTGMDFRRFTRCIILAQGDFSAFLKALDNERMDILEKIIGTEIYTDYKQNIVSDVEQQQQRLDQLMVQLNDIKLLTPAELEASRLDLADFKTQSVGFINEKEVFEQQLEQLTEVELVESNVYRIAKDIEDNQAEVSQLRSSLLTLEKFTELDQVLMQLTESDNTEEQINQYQKELSVLQTEIIEFKNELEQRGAVDRLDVAPNEQTLSRPADDIDKLKSQLGQIRLDKGSEETLLQTLDDQIQEKKVLLETVNIWLKNRSMDKILIDDSPDILALKKSRLEIDGLKEKKKTAEKDVKQILTANKKQQNEIKRLTKLGEQSEDSIAKLKNKRDALMNGKSLEDVLGLEEDQNNRGQTVKALQALSLKFKLFNQDKAGGWFRQSPVKVEIPAGLAGDYEQLLIELEQEQKIQNALQKTVSWEIQIRKHYADREALLDGEPCGLCGALDHPFVVALPEIGDSRQLLVDQSAKVDVLRDSTNHMKSQLKEYHDFQEQCREDERERTDMRAEWAHLCTRLNIVSRELTIDNLKAFKKLRVQEQNNVEHFKKVIKNYHLLTPKLEKLNQQLVTFRVELKALEDQEISLPVQYDSVGEIQASPVKIIEIELKNALEVEQDLLAKLVESIKVLGEKVPAKGREDKLINRLNQRRQDFQVYALRRTELTTELDELEHKRTQCQEENILLSEKLEGYTKQLNVAETMRLHVRLYEKQEESTAIDEKIQASNEERDRLTKKTMEILTDRGIASPEEVHVLANQKKDIPQIQATLLDLDASKVGLQAKHTKKKVELTQLQSEFDFSRQDVEQALNDIENKLNIAEQESHHVESVLAQQVNLVRNADEINHKIEQQQQCVDDSRKVLAEFELEDSRVFRKRIQQDIASNLLKISNEYLEKISGRYCLSQIKEKQGLALAVIDSLQDNKQRSTKTLSGGETFIISLSLALGLSEIANYGRAVDSLFIDEGFGTLDEESLYVVLSTLENLRHEGKLVGVISHIQELQERVKTQIRMSREQGGFSRLEVVA